MARDPLLWNDVFSHIYVEERASQHYITLNLLNKLQKSIVVPIKHYKDFFNRPKQDFIVQKESPKLILASRADKFLYKGAAMCDRYGHSQFYYATLMMNCLYNCAYCYLQGMYQSANVVAFVNPKDYFTAVKEALPAYVSISYDADVLALEELFGYVNIWYEFAQAHKNLTLEVRTKSANFDSISQLQPINNLILSWTVSPQNIADTFEHKAPSINLRINSIKKALNKNWLVRLCLDPILPIPNWESDFADMLSNITKEISLNDLYDISVGGFRMSEPHYKKLRRIRPNFPIFSSTEIEQSVLRAKQILKEVYGYD